MNKGCELQKLIRCYSDNVDDQLIQFSRISQVEFSGRTRLFLVTYLKTLLCKVKDEASSSHIAEYPDIQSCVSRVLQCPHLEALLLPGPSMEHGAMAV